ncbi:hypothetical protein [Pseudomonas sp. NFACC36]|uniref:hypothetical protein n=1 Tax=Pseudomonas sp. NFACC36 TaxID=1566197 RepID=UPI000924187C|nr:hypothetical protein [Pseudomonas sp. NFACC36]SFY12189.1 hypothetical protein SAMN03159309_04113 [Pseudomonas sp. NFACC36]
MAVKHNISVETFDVAYALPPDQLIEFFKMDASRWDWLNEVSHEAANYYVRVVQSAREEITTLDLLAEVGTKRPLREIDLKYYTAAAGELGQFILQTRHQHGGLVAFYALQIATDDAGKSSSVNKSNAIVKSISYEFQLAHFLFFQYVNAADYVVNNTNQKINAVLKNFNSAAENALKDITIIGKEVQKVLSSTAKEQARVHVRYKRRAVIALRRYKTIFSAVRKEASAAKTAASEDLKKAFETYHAQVDLNSSIVYWNDKAIRHNKAKWYWLGVVVLSIILTFASPVVYYSVGGASALAAKRLGNLAESTQIVQPVMPQLNQGNPPSSETSNEEAKPAAAVGTIEKVAFASGIADLTGAALIVALMSVFLRLSLRQYNTYIHLGHDAEERVTMLKTYLALSNEGKLTMDGDMKLVLDALFRPSQFSGVPDSTPATPIELIIKAITERK